MKNTKMLKKNYEFRFVLTKGKYYSGRYIEAFVVKKNLELNKIGIAIKRNLGKAVKRNHIKRLIKESYRVNEQELNGGYNIVFLVKKKCDISLITFNDVQADMMKILQEIGKNRA